MAGRAAARPWAAPACRRARRCGPRSAPAPRAAGSAMPASRSRAAELPEKLTGALPTAPVPRAALVTGGARRIGRALALALAEAGYAVAVHHHRSAADATALAAEITAAGGK